MEELVFAIPTKKLWKLLNYKECSLILKKADLLNEIIQNGLFRKRSELEIDPNFKQIIPYAVITHEDSFYLIKRLSGQVDKRLHYKLTLGVGGHMNPDKSKELSVQYPMNELKREFFEEIELLDGCKIDKIDFIAFVNDDTIPIGKHHIGILYHIHISNKSIAIKETDKMSAEWVNKKDFAEYYDNIESWSQMAFDYITKSR